MQDLEVESDWFKYNETEMVVKGDQIIEDGRRIILFSSNDHPQWRHIQYCSQAVDSSFHHISSSFWWCVHSCLFCPLTWQLTFHLQCNVWDVTRSPGVECRVLHEWLWDGHVSHFSGIQPKAAFSTSRKPSSPRSSGMASSLNTPVETVQIFLPSSILFLFCYPRA